MTSNPPVGVLVEHLFREQAGRMVSHLAGLLGPAHLDLAEESVQDSMLRALAVWPQAGIPENPAAWLFRVARNASIDSARRGKVLGEKTEAIVQALSLSAETASEDPGLDIRLRDDELRMIFMCCHPGIGRDASIALSLKTVGGFSVGEIARAFLADETTIAQRLVRAKRRIRECRLTLDMPPQQDLPQRLGAVLDVLYFMFNEGYTAHGGETLIRRDLCLEALRLTRLIAASALAEPRVNALAALMAFHAARLAARTDQSGDLILLEQQDPALWDAHLIAAGFHYFDASIAGDAISEFHVQAAIAATHARAPDPESSDWPMILELYDQLFALNPSPVVALNRAVAIAKVNGPELALAELCKSECDPMMRSYYLFRAVRGHLLLSSNRREDAAECFRAALECPCSEPERRFLQRKLNECLKVQ